MDFLARDEDDRRRALFLQGAHDGLHRKAVREDDASRSLVRADAPDVARRHVGERRLKPLDRGRHRMGEHGEGFAARLEGGVRRRADIARERLARHAGARERKAPFELVEGSGFGLV